MHNLNSIPLSALRAIESIARNGTLASAAVELGITAGALSQRLSKAESVLGRPLFTRAPSGLRPTEICVEIAPRLTHAISELSDVVSAIRTQDNSVLTVSVAPIFASRWLIWRIQKFNQQNPDISVRVLPTVEMVDLDSSEVDVGIRVSQDPSIGTGAIKLLDQRVFPVCSAQLADSIISPAELLKMPIIRENEELFGWDIWLADQGISMPDLKSGPTYADSSLCLDAAMTGQGVFMAWETLASDALERGQIVSPCNTRSLTGKKYWFAASKVSAKSRKVNLFKSWLLQELECSVRHWQNPNGQ